MGVKCINHQAMEFILYLERRQCQLCKYKHAIKCIVHNSGIDVNVSLDCPTKLVDLASNCVCAAKFRDIIVIKSIMCVCHQCLPIWLVVYPYLNLTSKTSLVHLRPKGIQKGC